MVSVYESQLSELEKVELKDYKARDPQFQVYFLGEIASRSSAPADDSFNDDKGNLVAKKGTNIYFRYEILEYIGHGSFGKVYTAFDHKEKKEIGLKIIKFFPKEEHQIDLEPEILMLLKKS